MIPTSVLVDIFRRAAHDARVRTIAVVVVAAAVVLVGLRLVFGSSVTLQTDASQKCSVDLAGCSARLELTERAMLSCEGALDTISRRAP
jgi:hypothetical protein